MCFKPWWSKLIIFCDLILHFWSISCSGFLEDHLITLIAFLHHFWLRNQSQFWSCWFFVCLGWGVGLLNKLGKCLLVFLVSSSPCPEPGNVRMEKASKVTESRRREERSVTWRGFMAMNILEVAYVDIRNLTVWRQIILMILSCSFRCLEDSGLDCARSLTSACIPFSEMKMNGDVADSTEMRNEGNHRDPGKETVLLTFPGVF